MSIRARDHQHRADSGRVVAHHGSRHRAAGDYTLGHGSRQVRLGPVSFWIVVGSLVIMGVWSLLTGTYFAFHDDVLTRMIARQTEQKFAYEDRIAELRAQVDRITSRQMLDQEQFEQRLQQIARRQAVLESRAATLNAVDDPAVTGSIGRRRPAPLPDAAAGNGRLKPSPISDTIMFSTPPDREARLESRGVPEHGPRYALASVKSNAGVEGVLARVQSSLDRVETRQTSMLNALEDTYDSKVRRVRGVLSDLGIRAGKAPASRGMGGPYIPVTVPANAGAFERQLFRIKVARANLDQLHRTLAAVPVRKPIMGEIDLTSTFGVRSDPFGRGPAMHSGLDFRSNIGDPVRATATGSVVAAGWNGGYGKMVEIDHGNGLSTRYGHLSAIDVKVGQHIRIGQTIGRVGSTGRSTGPHLHYETRIDDTPVDPQKFLRAGIRLGNAI